MGTLDLYANLSSGTGTPTLTFDYINLSGTDSVKVQLSTNGGTTFTSIAGSIRSVSGFEDPAVLPILICLFSILSC